MGGVHGEGRIGAGTVLAAPDSFKGTASASAVAGAIAAGARAAGRTCDECPLSDGGEGFADVLAVVGGEVRTTEVHGPLGRIVPARWRLAGERAVVESAQASGLALVGGPAGNDPEAASSAGTGELLVAARDAGARRILVGLGGSATTDGGAGAVAAIEAAGGLDSVEVVVACDVETRFGDAAAVFGPQKGASPEQVVRLGARLDDLAGQYLRRYGVDVGSLAGAGAAGGLAGGLAALGARLQPGFDLVAEAVGLAARIRDAAVVVTGEGRFDATSWAGKVVGGVAGLAAGLPVLVVAGSADPTARRPPLRVVDLTARFGRSRARRDPEGCIAAVVEEQLAGL